MSEQVAVIGGGSWGCALAHVIGSNGFPVTLYVRRAEQAEEIRTLHTNQRYLKDYPLSHNITPTIRLQDAAPCGIIVMVVPSKGFRETAREMGDFLKPDQILLSATKGIEPGTHLRMSEILKAETACLKVGAISGPNLALEVMAGHPTATIVASRYNEVVAAGMQILNSTTFRAYGSQDIVGVELAGALKNVMALAAGIVTGIGYGANTRSFLISRGLSELIRMGNHYNVDPMTLSGLAGVGDLIVTCNSEQSRNFQVGKRLGQGESLNDILGSMQQVAEGIRTTQSAYELAKAFREPFPIIEIMYKLLYQGMSVQEAKLLLLGRPMHYEHEPERVVPKRETPKSLPFA
ncbi:NAD(P)-dependent glycerol-3-phosphate dehydrogenase [Myxococcota bacterium]|nr:NAD(P)-dependent glycerol-3-phosphate dehydrogenase [Myxococcota bacterium]